MKKPFLVGLVVVFNFVSILSNPNNVIEIEDGK